MIVFLVQGKHTYTHDQLVGCVELGDVICRNYDWILNRKRIPQATYVFTDRERMDPWELRIIGKLYAHLQQAGPGYRVLNDPTRMMGRRALLRALYSKGINRFNAFAVTERARPTRFPVFIRREFDHVRPVTGLLHDAKELDAALAELRSAREPEEGLLIIEYCAQPVEGKLFRKLSTYRIGECTFFYNTGHEESWLVKYGTLNAGTDALYEEESRMIRDNAYDDVLGHAFDIAGIEYGRADFGLVDGEVQIYEINSNPYIKQLGEHPNAIRTENRRHGWQKYCDALNALDTVDRNAPVAPPFTDDSLRRYWPMVREFGMRRLLR